MTEFHRHNGIDVPRIRVSDLEKLPSTTISEVTGTADATYSANEQNLINDLKTAVNALINILQK